MSAASVAQPAGPALESLDVIGRRIRSWSHLALFLDFDGTISRIATRPEEAEIAQEIRPVLHRLARRQDLSLAVVSGRSLADVRERVGLQHIAYAGNHGLEIESDEVEFREPRAEELRDELLWVISELKLTVGCVEGVKIEDKGLSASVHYRAVEEGLQHWVRGVSCEIVSGFRSFVVRQGKMVVEVRPRIHWNKGHAVKWILATLFPPWSLPIYIGDDATDEDAFVAIPKGITIRVGRHVETNAQYTLFDVAAVGKFLGWLDLAKG